MPTNKILTDFVINKVESQAVYDQMVANNLINDGEIYLVGGEANDTTVLYTPQELTDEQKAQVCANIGTLSENEITDLINTTLGDIENGSY